MRMNSIKVLAVIEARTVTGPAKNLIDFARRARSTSLAGAANVDVTIVTFNRGSFGHADETIARDGRLPPESEFIWAARLAGLRVVCIRERHRFDRRVIRQLRSIADAVGPDVIQTHGVKSHCLIRMAGLSGRYPWIAFHHGYTATDLKMRLFNHLDRWSLRAAERVVTVSEKYAAGLRARGVPASRLRVVHNCVAPSSEGVNPQSVNAVTATLGLGPGQRVILSVGRLSREKAHSVLVAAFARLSRSRTDLDLKLVIVGEGPEKTRITRAAVRLGISDRVVLTGQVAGVRPYLQIADVFVLPSLAEGSPNALLEAMTAGVPAVATRIGGVQEIVSDGINGLLVEPRNAERMADAIATVLDRPAFSRYLADNARATVRANHSPEGRVRSLLEIYQETAPGRIEFIAGVKAVVGQGA